MRKLLVIISLVLGSLIATAHAERINQIRVEGNRRIELETILSYLSIKKGEEYSTDKVNDALKDLYATGYFMDVDIYRQGSDTLVIKVLENAMINRLAFEGNSKLDDNKLRDEVQLRPREVVSKAKIRAAQQRILEIYRRMGRFGVKVEPKIIPLEENRVDLIFEIQEGETAYIRQINFVGNRAFSSHKLEGVILSRKAHWYRFFASDDVYDPDRLEADKVALRQFYLNSGFPDFYLASAVAELSPDGKDFYLTFTINEGEPYTFGKVELVSSIEKIKPEEYFDLLDVTEGTPFSAKKIEKAMSSITTTAGGHGYAFADVQPTFQPNRDEKTVDVKFEIKQGLVAYIERIEIIGNDRTRDHVIRREILLHEGDAFNAILLRKSEKRIRDLGYFKNVTISTRPGSAPDKAIVVIKVDEQSTGEFSVAGGYGTVDGLLMKTGFMERNFMGKGQITGIDVMIARKSQDVRLGFTEPYFLGKPLSLGGQLFGTRSTRLENYEHSSKGGDVTFGYELSEDWSHSITFGLHQDKVYHVDPMASVVIYNQQGRTTTSSVGHTLSYDNRDSKIEPTKGFIGSLSNTYSGIGGNILYFRTVVGAHYYYTPIEEMTLVLKGYVGRMDKVNGDEIRIVDSFQLGADTLRGFEYGGVGPRAVDTPKGDPLGGTRYWTLSADLLFPIGLPNELGIKGAVFCDTGCLWKPGTDNFTFSPLDQFLQRHGTAPIYNYIRDQRTMRVGAGFGISWSSPFGPLRIDYAFPIRRAKTDQTQRILFGFSTRF